MLSSAETRVRLPGARPPLRLKPQLNFGKVIQNGSESAASEMRWELLDVDACAPRNFAVSNSLPVSERRVRRTIWPPQECVPFDISS